MTGRIATRESRDTSNRGGKGTGSATDRLDPHGQFCTPVGGWGSITEDSKEWEIGNENV